ncbi:Mitochondrial branched-chain-amino-acid aminotransferase [Lachnellula suecica]|uniref:Branched-chain-amino-acid aminotransferase n=1 Tax=Lachnellula suecica TaxID=602035 RepID=A0A8T9CHP6_9HELO|nr:Mitochondrial branched-chain-amino-acid aminotransferase [Lachnellula suecica]
MASPGTFFEPQKLDASKLEIQRNPNPSKLIPPEGLRFGRYMTDHMLQVQWTLERGWQTPRILPYQKISLDPTACVFHYGFECFEGLKAYKDAEGRLRLFRPHMNMDRFKESAARVALPSFESEELIKLIAKFVRVEERKKGYSLYLRPVLVGTSGGLGVTCPTSALLYLVASPVGAYYGDRTNAISLEATNGSIATRAWPGGAGRHKVGGNYAPCVPPEKSAQMQGYQQCLWLFGEDDSITEAGSMNIFVAFGVPGSKRFQLVTPPLNGVILPGVTRDCILKLAIEKLMPLGWLISERKVTMSELVAASDAGEIYRVFGTGTAAIITPVESIRWGHRVIKCGPQGNNHGDPDEDLAQLLKGWIEDRQCGVEEHEWSVIVDEVER